MGTDRTHVLAFLRDRLGYDDAEAVTAVDTVISSDDHQDDFRSKIAPETVRIAQWDDGTFEIIPL